MVSANLRRLLTVLACLFVVGPVAAASLWWAFDSGPLSQEPRLVLTESADSGAVRVYGDYPGEDVGQAAQWTVDRLVAAGGVERKHLVVALPTGSGWIDPVQVLATEDWAGGDVATVSVRYSAAPSGAVYILRPALAIDSAHALLSEVAGRLRTIPPAERPTLLVHGQSLGAYAGAAALEDPALAEVVDIALWQGSPGARGRTAESGPVPCTVSSINSDDPVAELSWDLLREPVRAAGILADLPGSASASPGTRHTYLPLTPPDECPAPRRTPPAAHEWPGSSSAYAGRG